jgi:hypothetical protein
MAPVSSELKRLATSPVFKIPLISSKKDSLTICVRVRFRVRVRFVLNYTV